MARRRDSGRSTSTTSPDHIEDLRQASHRPDRRSATVPSSTDIAPFTMGFGQARFGEGKFDVEQMVIVDKNGDMRALSSVLQNVFDAWMTLLGQPLPPIND